MSDTSWVVISKKADDHFVVADDTGFFGEYEDIYGASQTAKVLLGDMGGVIPKQKQKEKIDG